MFWEYVRNSNFRLPTKATRGSLCWDVYMPYDLIDPGKEIIRIPLGIRWKELCRVHGQLKVRSSLCEDYMVLAGTIDSDYPAEWILKLQGMKHKCTSVLSDQRICQVQLYKCEETEELNSMNIRSGGFGSTGK